MIRFSHSSLWISLCCALVLFAGTNPSAASPPKATPKPRTHAAVPAPEAPGNPPGLLLGTAWYPEQWEESRWETDLSLMQAAGIRMVRVAEFAWSRMEPEEGRFDFDWLERAVALAAKHGIFVVLGTPSAAPPAWLTQKYPDTLNVNEFGHRATHGNR